MLFLLQLAMAFEFLRHAALAFGRLQLLLSMVQLLSRLLLLLLPLLHGRGGILHLLQFNASLPPRVVLERETLVARQLQVALAQGRLSLISAASKTLQLREHGLALGSKPRLMLRRGERLRARLRARAQVRQESSALAQGHAHAA